MSVCCSLSCKFNDCFFDEEREPQFQCVCGFKCPSGYCRKCCSRSEEHENCSRRLEAQRERKKKEKLNQNKAVQSQLQQDIDAHAQWQKNQADQQRQLIAQEKHQQKQLAERAARASQRAEQREATLKGRVKQTVINKLNCVSNLLLKQKTIVLSGNDEELGDKSAAVTSKRQSHDASDYHFVKEAAEIDASEIPLLPNPAMQELTSLPASRPTYMGKYKGFFQFFRRNRKDLPSSSSCGSSKDLLLAAGTSSLPDGGGQVRKELSTESIDNQPPCTADISGTRSILSVDLLSTSCSEDGIFSDSESLDGESSDDVFLSCEDLSPAASFFQDYIPKSLTVAQSMMSLADISAQNHQVIPLKKAFSMDSLGRQLPSTVATLAIPSASPVDQFLTNYCRYLSPEAHVTFHKQAGIHLESKLAAESLDIQESLIQYFYDEGSIYPSIMEQYPASDWLWRSLLQEVVQDPIADPVSKQTFQERWENICESYNTDQQAQLLQSLWKAKKSNHLSLAKINGVLELIIATGTSSNDIAYDEPLLSTLAHLKKYWLMAQLADSPQLSASVLESRDLADMLATSHLSLGVIKDILTALKESEEVINVGDLAEFLTLVNMKKVPEVIVSSVLQDAETYPISEMSKPQQWVFSLTCQLLYLEIEQADRSVSDDIVAALSKKIQQNRGVLAPVKEFIHNHLDLIMVNSAEFTDVLELLYLYQVGQTISAAVLNHLPKVSSSKWVEETDKVIISQLFRDTRVYTAEELMQLIARRSPAVLQDLLAVSTTNHRIADNMLESVYKRVAEALKPCIDRELKAVKDVYRGALLASKKDAERLKNKLQSLRNEKKMLNKDYDDRKTIYTGEMLQIQLTEEQIVEKLGELQRIREKELKKVKEYETQLKEKKNADAVPTSNAELDKSKEIRLKKKLDALNKDRSNLKQKLADLDFSYDDKLRELDGKEKYLEEELLDSESKNSSYHEKLNQFNQEDAAAFTNQECYKEVLESLRSSISDCELGASFLLEKSTLPFKNKPISEWAQQEVKDWSSNIQRQMQSKDEFSCGILELVAGIKHAMSLVQGPTPSSDQLYRLLTLLFPCFEEGPQMPIEDPLVVAMLSAISALHVRQLSIVTDSEQLPISKSDLKQFLPLFELLNVTAVKKSSWDSSEASADKNYIIYGTFFHFKSEGSNLIAVNQLKKRQHAVSKRYEAPSTILQAAEGVSTLLKDKAISSWDERDVSQWAKYVQQYMPSNPQHSHPVSLEYIAAIKRAVILAHGKSPTLSQLWALFTSLDGSLDKGQLTKQDQKEALVMAMSTAVNALQTRQFDVTSVCGQLPTSSLDKYLLFFRILNLQVEFPLAQEPVETNTPATSPTELNEESDTTCTPADPSTSASNNLESLATIEKNNHNYTILKQAYAAILAAYLGPSVLLTGENDNCQFTDKPIAEWDRAQLTAWATQVRAMQNPNILLKGELIAGVKRAVELVHRISPRDAQLLTLLTLLSESGKGCLAQVNTGEGKSLIVAMLAAIHALQGKHVDVVTTSTELSKPEVRKQRPLFKLLNLTVAENSQGSDKVATYNRDIVYGTPADFQADILREEFLGDNVRGYRRHDVVLVDEVDSLLYDSRSYSVRLSTPNPGMQHATLPLATIWHHIQLIVRHMLEEDGQTYFIPEDFERIGVSVQLASGADWRDLAVPVPDRRKFITEKTTKYLENLLRELNHHEQQEYEEFLEAKYALTALEQQILTATNTTKRETLQARHDELNKELAELAWNQRHPILDIPKHLQNFARLQIPSWIQHGLNAMFAFKKNAHYAVINDKIVPIQYEETGMLESNMVWSDGLTQFLQIKEGLPVDPEGIVSNYISNVGFFKRYGFAIYGLTGTLGGQATQDFLRELFNTDFVIIPPHKRRMIKDNDHSPYLCKELAPLIVQDQASWFSTIMSQVLLHARQKRAVLVICKYIHQVHHLAEQLRSQYDRRKIFTYTGEDAFAKENLNSGEIIIATNISGRGTDFKPSKSVEDHGGLYVAVTFLPENYRVELQNMGRTARAGNKGMCQLILYQKNETLIEILKAERSEKEETATNTAKETAKKMLLQDALFQNFCRLEAKYLPSAHDCENVQLAETLTPQWEAYLCDNGSDQIVAEKFQEWKRSTKEKWQDSMARAAETDQLGLDANDQAVLNAKFEEDLELQKADFQKQYRTELLKRFSGGRPAIPPAVWRSLEKGVPLTPPMSDLSKRYNWGIFERKALEERWALWLKGKHIENRDLAETLSLLREFEEEFTATIERAAENNKLIENPYFCVLKGNNLMKKRELTEAVVCYDCAISSDPIFSVHARYNKAQALLRFDENKGERQERALQELKQAETIIKTVYQPNLLAFHSLVANAQVKASTAQHMQQQLNIIGQLGSYIQRACAVIEGTKEDVKLSEQLIKKTLHIEANDNYDKVIEEVNANGLTHLFTIAEKAPTPWFSIVSLGLISLAQLTAGVWLTVYGGTGLGLIREGIADLIATVRAAVTGSFSWAAWAMQKVVSLAISFVSAGWSGLKESCIVARNCVKSLLTPAVRVVAKESIKQACKVLATELGKGAVQEVLSEAGQWCTDKLVQESLDAPIRAKIEETLTQALRENRLVHQALELDKKLGSSHWKRIFLQEGSRLLANTASLGPVLTMLKAVGKGVAVNKIRYANEVLLFGGVAEMLMKLVTFIDDFMKRFNQRVASHQEAIQAQQRERETRTTPTNLNTQSVPPVVDLEEENIRIDQIEESTQYSSAQTGENKPLSTDFDNLGPSTVENLISHFKNQISQALIDSTQQQLRPMVGTVASTLTGRLFKDLDTANMEFLTKAKEDSLLRHYNSQSTKKNEAKLFTEESKLPSQPEDAVETTTKKSSSTTSELTAETELFKESFQKDGPKDKTALGPLSFVTGRNIEIYNVEGDRTDVVENQNKVKGQPIKLVFEPGKDDRPGHYRPLDSNQIKNCDYQIDPFKGNCLMDAVLVQLPSDELAQLGGCSGVIQKGLEHIDAHPKAFNQLCEQRKRVQWVDAEALKLGGLIEWTKSDFRKALREHNYEEADRLKAQSRQQEIAAVKQVLPPVVGIGASLTPAGIPGGIAAGSATSALLDDKLRGAVSAGDWSTAGQKLIDHVPVVGSGKQAFENYQRGNYKEASVNTLSAVLEGTPLPGGTTKAASGITRQGARTTDVTKFVSEGATNLPVVRTQLGAHALERSAERGITRKMAEKAIEKGTRYYDPKNDSLMHVLPNSMASGDHLVVAANPLTGQVKTVFTGSDLRKRWVPVDK